MTRKPRILGQKPKAERRRIHDADRTRRNPWRAWYGLKAWHDRRDEQLAIQPLCERCLAEGKVEAATVANHRIPHRGDWDLFITGELESSCKPHHDRDIQREERAAAKGEGRVNP